MVQTRLALALSASLGIIATPAVAQGLQLVDLSESGETLHFTATANQVAIDLLDNASWDQLEFEVRGAEPGSPIGFSIAAAPAELRPEVTEGNFEWFPVEATRIGNSLSFAVMPNQNRFTVRLFERPTPDAPYYTYDMFVAYMAQIQNEPRAQITFLGNSVQGRPLYRIIIDTPSNQSKKTVLMTARQHGNEFGSNYVVEGVLDLLLDRNGHTAPRYLLDRVRWIIYPMVNPDGAVANQRGNSFGVDLNRDWDRNGCSAAQQLETTLHQCDVEMMQATYGIDIGGDHHGWGSTGNHGGFRYAQGQSSSFVSVPEYQEARKDTEMIEKQDPSQFNWSENGGTAGMIRAEMFLRYGFLLHTPEYDSFLSTPAHFREKGRGWARAMYDTLYAPRFTDASGNGLPGVALGGQFYVSVDDLDENTLSGQRETVTVTVVDSVTGDSEMFVLTETGNQTAVFRNEIAIGVVKGVAVPGNGVLESTETSKIIATYQDDDYARDTSQATMEVVEVLPASEAVLNPRRG